MENTVKDISELKRIIKDIGYNFICLESADGDKIVSANSKVTPINEKIKEIEKRLNILPKGIYKIGLRTTYGRGLKNDYYYISTAGETLSEIPQQIIIKEKSENPNVLSYEKALQYIQKIAELENENKFLKAENEKLKIDFAELEAEIEEEEEAGGLSEFTNNSGNWLNSMLPALVPIAEKYFDIEEKKLQLKAVQIANNTTPPKSNNLPEIGSEEFNALLNELSAMEDNEFSESIEKISKVNKEFAEKVLEQFL